jgi:hypothetical protein
MLLTALKVTMRNNEVCLAVGGDQPRIYIYVYSDAFDIPYDYPERQLKKKHSTPANDEYFFSVKNKMEPFTLTVLVFFGPSERI